MERCQQPCEAVVRPEPALFEDSVGWRRVVVTFEPGSPVCVTDKLPDD